MLPPSAGGFVIPKIVISLTLAILSWFPIRRWYRRWGATAADLTRDMPGDADVADPTYSTTLAVPVDALPEHIWPWLVQMGHQRGGLYSYDWLDRLFGFLDRPSATCVLPQFQQLEVGDEIPIGRGAGFPVKAIDANRALVLGGEGDGQFVWVWQFGLYSLDTTRTRLVSRDTARVPATVGLWLFMRVLEPATRRMLIGLKRRAEDLAARQRDRSIRAA